MNWNHLSREVSSNPPSTLALTAENVDVWTFKRCSDLSHSTWVSMCKGWWENRRIEFLEGSPRMKNVFWLCLCGQTHTRLRPQRHSQNKCWYKWWDYKLQTFWINVDLFWISWTKNRARLQWNSKNTMIVRNNWTEGKHGRHNKKDKQSGRSDRLTEPNTEMTITWSTDGGTSDMEHPKIHSKEEQKRAA